MCRHNEGGPAAANFHVCFLPSTDLATHVASQQQRRRVKVQQMQQMQDEAAAASASVGKLGFERWGPDPTGPWWRHI